MSDENFKNHPKSFAEVRSDKSEKAAHWTPRDALIAVLRRIDNGEKIDELVICYAKRENEWASPGYICATSSPLITVGVVEISLQMIIQDQNPR